MYELVIIIYNDDILDNFLNFLNFDFLNNFLNFLIDLRNEIHFILHEHILE